MKKLTSIIVIAFLLNACMVDIGTGLVNSKGRMTDFGSTDKDKFGIAFYTELESIYPEDALMKNRSDSLNPRLAYKFLFLNPTLPQITINSFSFKRLNGEEIPSMLYYKNDTGIVILNSLPYLFKNKEDLLVTISGLQVIAECSESYHQTKDVYINFDIEIDTVRVDTSIFYTRKLFVDWRPKF